MLIRTKGGRCKEKDGMLSKRYREKKKKLEAGVPSGGGASDSFFLLLEVGCLECGGEPTRDLT